MTIELDRQGNILSLEEEAEALRYQGACEALTNNLLALAKLHSVCPWCLLMHTGIAVKGAIENGDIEHEDRIMQHRRH